MYIYVNAGLPPVIICMFVYVSAGYTFASAVNTPAAVTIQCTCPIASKF